MRIIAGEAKGRRLKSIKNNITRPTADRIKESVFGTIHQWLQGVDGLDLFAGFGNLGLEALSRGAHSVIFIEKDYRNVEIIKQNVELCGFQENSLVKRGDAFNYLCNTKEVFDLILVDPPYGKGMAQKALQLIYKNNLLTENGFVIVEHGITEVFNDIEGFKVIREKGYGDTGVKFFQLKGEDEQW